MNENYQLRMPKTETHTNNKMNTDAIPNQQNTCRIPRFDPRQHCGSASSMRRKSFPYSKSFVILSMLALINIRFSEAFVHPITTSTRPIPPQDFSESNRNDLKFTPQSFTILPIRNSKYTLIQARRKTAAPEKVVPLKSKTRPSSSRLTKRKRKGNNTQFAFGSSQSEAFLSTIAIAAEMDDTVASVYSSVGQSQTYVSRQKGRPASVAGAMNKSTLMNNIEAEAAADEIIASGSVSPKSKGKLIEIAQQEKREADRRKYYDDVVEDSVKAPTSSYEENAKTEKPHSSPPSSSPPPEAEMSPVTAPSPSTEPPKRKRGRPRKYPLPEQEIISSPSPAPRESQYTSTLQSQGGTISQVTRPKSRVKKLKRSKTKQVRKRDPNSKLSKLKGDKLSLQQYYNTELLTAPEEYSLGMKVQFLMQCEEVYHGLTAHLMRNPSIAEWAYACG